MTNSTQAPADPMIGRVLKDAYRIDLKLGEGGMGAVYRGVQLAVDRPVAIKLVRHEPFSSPDRIRELNLRFEREARATSRLNHPNTVRLIDFGRAEEGLLFLVLQLLDGRNLADVVDREAPLKPIRAAHIGRQIAKSLTEAHSFNIIHRDLKPENIFLCSYDDEPDFVKVMDFGIASFVDPVMPSATSTADRVVVGSPCYMSPEQADAGDVTPASDLYSLGIMLYEMVTGQVPFDGKSAIEVFLKHLHEPLPRLDVPGVPENVRDAWWNLLTRLLDKEPDKRPSSASQVASELKDLRELSRDMSTSIPANAYLSTTISLAAIRALAEEMGYDLDAAGEPGLAEPSQSALIVREALKQRPPSTQIPVQTDAPQPPQATEPFAPLGTAPASATIPPRRQISRSPTTRATATRPPFRRADGAGTPWRTLLLVAAALVLVGAGFMIGTVGQSGGKQRGPAPIPEERPQQPSPVAAAPIEPAEVVADASSTGEADAVTAGDVAAAEAASGDAGPTAEVESEPELVGPTSHLVLKTKPEAVSVFRGQDVLCVTPCDLDVAANRKTERLRLELEGYRTKKVKVRLREGKVIKKKVRLRKKRR